MTGGMVEVLTAPEYADYLCGCGLNVHAIYLARPECSHCTECHSSFADVDSDVAHTFQDPNGDHDHHVPEFGEAGWVRVMGETDWIGFWKWEGQVVRT